MAKGRSAACREDPRLRHLRTALTLLAASFLLLCASGCPEADPLADPPTDPLVLQPPPQLPHEKLPQGFVYRDPQRPGRFRVARGPIDPHALVVARLQPDGTFIPMGINYAWPSIPAGATEFKTTLPELAANRVNLIRIWQSTWGFDLGGWNESGKLDGPGVKALDEVFAEAAKYNIRILLVYDNHFDLLNNQKKHGIFRASGQPGGVCNNLVDYFSSPAARKIHAARLKALMAHYGASPTLFGIEFMNEIDLVLPTGQLYPGNKETLEGWAHFMAGVVAAERRNGNLNAWHPAGISTVYTHTLNFHTDPRYDWVSVHLYLPEGLGLWSDEQFNETELVGLTSLYYEFSAGLDGKRKIWNLPHRPWIMEYGFGSPDSVAKRNFNDPDGRHLRHALWAALAGGGEGAPMPWWWDTYVLPNKLYRLYKPLAEVLEHLPLDSNPQAMIATQGQVRLTQPAPPAPAPQSLVPGFPAVPGITAAAPQAVNLGFHCFGMSWPGRVFGYVSRDGTAWSEKNAAALLSGVATLDCGEQVRAKITVLWINPADGNPAAKSQTIDHPGGVLKIDTPPFSDDLAFVLRMESPAQP